MSGILEYDVVSGLKNKLSREVHHRIHSLSEFSGYDGDKSNLETLLSPIFLEPAEADGDTYKEGVLSLVRCDVPDNMYGQLLHTFGETMVSTIPSTLLNTLDSDKIQVAFSFPLNDKFYVNRFDLSIVGKPELSFSAEYRRSYSNSIGFLKVLISRGLARSMSVEHAYMFLWNRMVSNSKRLESALTNTAEAKIDEIPGKLGLKLYRSGTPMSAVGGYKRIKDEIERDVFFRFKNSDMIRKVSKLSMHYDYDPANAILLYGPPGTGKTLMARAIASAQNLDMITFSLSSVFSKWYGESQRRLKNALDYIVEYSKDKKVVLFIDEIDFLGKRGGSQSTDREDTRVLDNLLMWMDGTESEGGNDNLLVICSTNFTEGMDQALSSRFKSKIYFPPPETVDRYEIFKVYAGHLSDKELKLLADSSAGMVGRDIAAASKRAALEWSRHLVSSNIKRASRTPFEYYMDSVKKFHLSSNRMSGFGKGTPEDLYG